MPLKVSHISNVFLGCWFAMVAPTKPKKESKFDEAMQILGLPPRPSKRSKTSADVAGAIPSDVVKSILASAVADPLGADASTHRHAATAASAEADTEEAAESLYVTAEASGALAAAPPLPSTVDAACVPSTKDGEGFALMHADFALTHAAFYIANQRTR